MTRARPKEVMTFPFPLPPLPEQKRIVHRVESLLGKIEEAKQLIEEARESYEQRRAAILAKAFRGELVPQDSNDEPASVLLERIAAERAAAERAATESNGKNPRSSPRPVLGKLSAEAKAARAPLRPEELVEAQHDRVHRDPGRARAARTVRNSRRGTT